MWQKKKFQKKVIGEVQNYTSYTDIIKPRRKWSFAKVFFVIVCIFIAIFFAKYLITLAQSALSKIAEGTVHVVSNSMWEDMKKDAFGNINIMIVGYGWEGHAGSFLADSIMVASFNPKIGAVTMISVPRDLYVYHTGYGIAGRINELFSVGVGRQREYATGATILSDMVQQIMGLDIPYYALIDFEWFKNVIDTLWGVTIDVPEGFVDTTYPTKNNGYMTVSFSSGIQNMNGEKALQYARSRHSTSDFARSLRQQQIIRAIIEKATSQWLTTVTKIKKLYEDYTNMVKTNISLKELMWMAKYVYTLDHVFSYGFTTECSNITYKYSFPGCFLYTPSRDLFGWASVMIPDWGAPGKVWFYEYTKNFVSYVAHRQTYLVEGAKIGIMNGIDKKIARQTVGKSEGFANQLAVKLRKYAFDVVDVKNFSQPISGTTLYILSSGDVKNTIETLKTFISIETIEETPSVAWFESFSGVDIVLVLGNSYLQTLIQNPFNYYK